MSTSEKAGGERREPVRRSFEIIHLLARSETGETGIREMARLLEVSPAAVLRLIRSLVDCGVMERNPSRPTYLISQEFARTARLIAEKYSMAHASEDVLKQLMVTSGETVLLAEYDPVVNRVMFSSMVESAAPVRFVGRLNEWMPIDRAASGLVVLAALSGEELERSTAEAREAIAQKSSPWGSMAELEQVLEGVRARGFAYTHGHRIDGAIGVFAPVLSAQGKPLGGVGLTIPAHRFDPDRTDDYGLLVKQAAAAIEDRLWSGTQGVA